MSRRVQTGSMNGIRLGEGVRLSADELRRRRALIPDDTRDLTGRVFGDPIPGDPRRQTAREVSE